MDRTATGRCYVYVIRYPDGVPAYVGKGSGERMHVHWRRFVRGQLSGRRRCAAGLAALFRAFGPLQHDKVAEGLSDAEAFALETALIAEHRVTLVNVHSGGDGGCCASYLIDEVRPGA